MKREKKEFHDGTTADFDIKLKRKSRDTMGTNFGYSFDFTDP